MSDTLQERLKKLEALRDAAKLGPWRTAFLRADGSTDIVNTDPDGGRMETVCRYVPSPEAAFIVSIHEALALASDAMAAEGAAVEETTRGVSMVKDYQRWLNKATAEVTRLRAVVEAYSYFDTMGSQEEIERLEAAPETLKEKA